MKRFYLCILVPKYGINFISFLIKNTTYCVFSFYFIKKTRKNIDLVSKLLLVFFLGFYFVNVIDQAELYLVQLLMFNFEFIIFNERQHV